MSHSSGYFSHHLPNLPSTAASPRLSLQAQAHQDTYDALRWSRISSEVRPVSPTTLGAAHPSVVPSVPGTLEVPSTCWTENPSSPSRLWGHERQVTTGKLWKVNSLLWWLSSTTSNKKWCEGICKLWYSQMYSFSAVTSFPTRPSSSMDLGSHRP